MTKEEQKASLTAAQLLCVCCHGDYPNYYGWSLLSLVLWMPHNWFIFKGVLSMYVLIEYAAVKVSRKEITVLDSKSLKIIWQS